MLPPQQTYSRDTLVTPHPTRASASPLVQPTLSRHSSNISPPPFIVPLNEDEIEAKEALETELAETKAELHAMQAKSRPSSDSNSGGTSTQSSVFGMERETSNRHIRDLEEALAHVQDELRAVSSEKQLGEEQASKAAERDRNKLRALEEELVQTKAALHALQTEKNDSSRSSDSSVAFDTSRELNKLMREHEVLLDEHTDALSRLGPLERQVKALQGQLRQGTSECLSLLAKLEEFAVAVKMPHPRSEPPPSSQAGAPTNIISVLLRQVDHISEHGESALSL